MVYQECGPLCPQTCDEKDDDCPGGCAPGCFCPYRQYLLDGVCVDEEVCTGNNIMSRDSESLGNGNLMLYVTWSGKTGLIEMTGSPIFGQKYRTT